MNATPKILIVDDDPVIVAATRRVLESAGYETLSAQDGQAALELARAQHPDLVLLDVNMDKMGGFETCRHIKTDPALAEIFVIIVSGSYTDTDSQVMGLGFGADGYIARPVTNRELLARVQAMLRIQKAEKALRESEQKFRSLTEQSPDGVTIIDEQGMITGWNAAQEKISGLPRSEAIGKPMWEMQAGMLPEETRSPANLKSLEANVQDILRTGQSIHLNKPKEMEIQRPDGTRCTIELNLFGFETSKGFMAGSIIRDITERKQTEKALKESRLLFNLLIESLPQNIYAKDVEGRFVFANQHYCALQGKTLDEIVGKTDFELHPSELAQKYRADDHRVIETGQAIDLEEEHQPVSGEKSFIQVIKTPFYDSKGQIAGTLGIFWDITERKQAEENLRRRTHEAETLHQVAASLTSSLDLNQVLESLLSQLAQVVPYDSVTVFLLKNEQLLAVTGRGLPAPEKALGQFFPASNELFDEMRRTGRPLIIADAQKDPRFQKWGGADYVHGWMGVPLVVRGELIGRLTIDSREVNAFSETEAKLALAFANQAAIAIQNAHLYEQAQREIAERKQVDESLRESEEKFRMLAEHSPNMIFINQKGRIVYANAKCEELTGYKRGEFYAPDFDFFKLVAPESWPMLRDIFTQHQKGNEVQPYEYTLITKDGRRLEAINASKLVRFENESAILGVISDITERKRSEKITAALYKISKAANTSDTLQALFVRIYEALNDFLNAKNCFIALIDSTGEKITFPYEIDEHPDDSPVMIALTDPKSLTAEVIRSRKPWLLDEQQLNERYASGKSRLWKNKPKCWMGVPLLLGERVIGAMAVQSYDNATKYTDEDAMLFSIAAEQVAIAIQSKQAEAEIRQLNAELEQRVDERSRELRETQEQLVRQEKLAVLGQLAGGVGHELRNPLGVINNATYYLRLVQPEADGKVKEYLGIIEQETHNADKIISDLLDFSRIKSVDLEPVIVSELVRRTLERFPAPENVQVTLKLSENLPRIYVDPRQVTQVIGNLVLNACQAMAQGGQLSINSKVKNKMVSIIVKDTGSGITPENMKKLFEPLFTTKPKGIGLGLAVSQKLTEANGGRIEVESEPGKGSTFTLWLPVSREEEVHG